MLLIVLLYVLFNLIELISSLVKKKTNYTCITKIVIWRFVLNDKISQEQIGGKNPTLQKFRLE
jgi:hypothetical protein